MAWQSPYPVLHSANHFQLIKKLYRPIQSTFIVQDPRVKEEKEVGSIDYVVQIRILVRGKRLCSAEQHNNSRRQDFIVS